MELKGKGFLKITGIILLVFAGLQAISFFVSLFTLDIVGALFALLISGAELVCGIMGVKGCGDAKKANTCLILGICLAGLQTLTTIISIAISPWTAVVQLVGLLIGLALPALYVLGALKNAQAAKSMGCTVGSFDFNSLRDDVFSGMKDAAGDVKNAAGSKKAPEAGAAAVNEDGSWLCSCGHRNNGNFCLHCGSAKPEPQPASTGWTCACGTENEGNFCGNCGARKPE